MNPANMTARNNLKKSRSIRKPNRYIRSLLDENSIWSLDEERAEVFKGHWRQKVFEVSEDTPMDLEIGVGVGYYFVHRATIHPNRCLLGLEIMFKSLYQATERAKRAGLRNFRTVRYDASFIKDLFAARELNDVIIHHPDPWSKRKKQKHRLLQPDFLQDLSRLQRPGSVLELKTDSEDYYKWALQNTLQSPYQVFEQTEDLHNSEYAKTNFITQFERIFLQKGQPIFFFRARI